MTILLYREHVFASQRQSEMKNDDSSIQKYTSNCDSETHERLKTTQNFGKTGFFKDTTAKNLHLKSKNLVT